MLFKTSWIGLRASQRGKRWHTTGAHGDRVGCGGRREVASLCAPGKGAARRSEGLGVRSQLVRCRPHLLGMRIFRGVGSTHRGASYSARVAAARSAGRVARPLRGAVGPHPSAPLEPDRGCAGPGPLYHPTVKLTNKLSPVVRSTRKNRGFRDFPDMPCVKRSFFLFSLFFLFFFFLWIF